MEAKWCLTMDAKTCFFPTPLTSFYPFLCTAGLHSRSTGRDFRSVPKAESLTRSFFFHQFFFILGKRRNAATLFFFFVLNRIKKSGNVRLAFWSAQHPPASLAPYSSSLSINFTPTNPEAIKKSIESLSISRSIQRVSFHFTRSPIRAYNRLQ